MATEKNLQTIDLKIGSQEQLTENINTYDEGTLFGTTDLISVGDLTPDLRNKVESNAKTNASNTFAESQIFNKDITVNGNIIQNGDAYKTHAEELYTKKDIIFTRDGAVSSLGDAEYTGLQAVKYDGTNDGQLVFDKDGVARVGDVGDTQPLATRSEKEDLVGGNLLQWDAAGSKIIDAGKSTSQFLELREPTGVQTDFVMIRKSSASNFSQVSATGVATVSEGHPAAYAPVLRGSQGRLTCLTAPEASQTEYDCVNRGELSKYTQKFLELSGEDGTLDEDQYNLVVNTDNLIIRRSSVEYRLQSKPLNGSGDYVYVSIYYVSGDAEEFAAYIITIKSDKTWSWKLKSFLSASAQAQIIELNSPAEATNGNLTEAQLSELQSDSRNYIKFNNEYYYLADDGHTEGMISYTHNGWNGNSMQDKSINITENTGAWSLATGCAGYRHYCQLTVDSYTIYYDFVSSKSTPFTQDSLPVNETITTIFALSAGGYYSTVSGHLYRSSADNQLKAILYGIYTTNGTSFNYLSIPSSDATLVSDTVEQI